MLKKPIFLLPLITLGIFCIGYIYEWGYLSKFGVPREVVNLTYSELLVVATHGLIMIITTFEVLAFIIAMSYVTALFKYSTHSQRMLKVILKNFDSVPRFIVSGIFPFFIFVSMFLPGKFGEKEATKLIDNLAGNWQEITLISNPDRAIKGLVVRTIGQRIVFYPEDEKIVFVVPLKQVISIKYYSKNN